MFVYLLYVGNYNSTCAQVYGVYEEDFLAQEMGEQLKEGGYCNYYYVSREPLVRVKTPTKYL